MRRIVFCFMLLFGANHAAYGQHSIDVQRKAADGDYMAALVTYDKMPKKITTTGAQIAAARSAWALGLTDRALEEFDRALKNSDITVREQGQIYLSKGIIEFQENRPQIAELNVEKALAVLKEPSPMRGQVYALWGDSLSAMKQFSKAIEQYERALGECEASQALDVHFHLAEAQLALGQFDDAKDNFEKIPLKNERAPTAIRYLAKIGLETKNLANAGFWLSKGREEFPDSFLDSWVDYVMMQSAIEAKDGSKVREIRTSAEKRFAPSDPWLVVLTAAAEQYEWQGGAADE